ncbi:MAG: hypothetical protein P9X24_01130 [Candidatus Hatepunaea meridiana]|nr:hypothetical protein [Candidatus Hatepunaea meridiana]
MPRSNKLLLSIILCTIILFTVTDTQAVWIPETDGADYLSRMFIAPTGRVVPSGVVNVAFGGAFASQGGREYLGLISAGLGDVAEFEISTSQILTNIFNFTEPIGTTTLKFNVYQGKPNSKMPTVMVALRSNRWSEVEGSGDELVGPASDGNSSNIIGVDFETHITSLYLSATSDISSLFTLHGGIVWLDVRTRNTIIRYNDFRTEPRPEDLKKGIVSFFGGVEHLMNKNTFSLIEFGARPQIKFNEDMKKITLSQLWHVMAGVRFYFSRLTALDAGVMYRSDYSGLADAEIRAGLNLGLDVAKEVERVRKKIIK